MMIQERNKWLVLRFVDKPGYEWFFDVAQIVDLTLKKLFDRKFKNYVCVWLQLARRKFTSCFDRALRLIATFRVLQPRLIYLIGT